MQRRKILTEAERMSVTWRKAQISTNNGSCVEVASVVGKIALRDSKDPSGPLLVYTPAEWNAFLDGSKKGELDDLAFEDRSAGPVRQDRQGGPT
jgi:Domain of unknown function (DUF397)